MTEPDFVADLAILAQPARQSPIAIVSEMLGNIRRLGAANLVVAAGAFISARVPAWSLVFLPAIGLAFLASGVVAWWHFTFRATTDSLIVTGGVIGRTELTIPFTKVQSVTVDEGLVDRLFGLFSATVDTAGDEAAEFSIRGISQAQAEGLRRLASQKRTGPDPVSGGIEVAAGPPNVGAMQQLLLHRSPAELAWIGLLTNPLGGITVFGALAFFADDVLGTFGVELTRLTSGVSPPSVLVVSLILLAALLIAAIGTSLRTVVSDWNFRLTSNQDGLEISAGLFRRRSRSSRLNKIQSVEAATGPLMRRIGFSRLRLTTIGSGDLIVPGVTEGELLDIRALVQTQFAEEPSQAISNHYVWYRLRTSTSISCLAALATATVDVKLAMLWILVPTLIVTRSFFYWRKFRWELERETISIRWGSSFENEIGMNLRKVQSVTVTQNYYQRKRSLAAVTIANAGSAISIPMISLREANFLRDQLLHLLVATV